MKQFFKLAIAASIALTLVNVNDVKAQAGADETQMIQGMYGMEKRDIVKQYMVLSPPEADKFWKIYDEYEVERKKVGAERIQILMDYANAYSGMTNEQADNLMNRIFSSDMAYEKMRKTYYTKMAKELGALKAATFFQLEGYLQTAVRFTVQDNIPFIGELEKKKKP
jgi:hypothetical protein